MAQRLALVIGNDDYNDPTLARLTAPQGDIAAFAALLKDPQRGAFDAVEVLHNEPQAVIRRRINLFFESRKLEDLLLLYFSGHGVLNAEGQLYLATQDTERELLDATAVSAFFVNRLMRSCFSRRQVLILDCCHSGAFERGAKSLSVGTQVHIGEAFSGDGTGHIVLAASKATEYAFEGDKVIGSAQTSFFTGALIEGIQTGHADLNLDGFITPEELYDYAYQRVRELSPHQTPGKWAYNKTGQIVLARSPRRRLPDEILALLAEKDASRRFGAVDDLASLARGEDPALAQLAYDQLREMSKTDDSITIQKAAIVALQERQSKHVTGSVSDAKHGTRGEMDDGTLLEEVAELAARATQSIPWTGTWWVIFAWILAANASSAAAEVVDADRILFYVITALSLAIVAGYTFNRVLRTTHNRSFTTGTLVTAGIISVVPILGPVAFVEQHKEEHLISWAQLGTIQRLLLVVHYVTSVVIHGYLIYTVCEFAQNRWPWSQWWRFDVSQLKLSLMFALYGVILYVGTILVMRTIAPQGLRNS